MTVQSQETRAIGFLKSKVVRDHFELEVMLNLVPDRAVGFRRYVYPSTKCVDVI